MAEVNKAKSPYYDDFDEDKNYHEILFRPRFAVQTRELNQIQSIFREQLARFGNNIFKNGSMVIPGETNYDLELEFIALTISNYDDISYLLIEGEMTVENSSGVKADVKLIRKPEGTDPLAFYLQYTSSGANTVDTSRFAVNDVVTIKNSSGDTITDGTVTNYGLASKFTIGAGVYYINERFVLVQGETVILDKFGNMPSKIVTIEYEESVVTENEDSSLFDNAQGTPNFTAPGAHRLRVDTKLGVHDLDDLENLSEDSVEIFRIENGSVQNKAEQSDYNVLNDVLARRTYEESGDYTVKAFNVGFAEYGDAFPDEDESKFVTELEAGIAYVKGYRVENLSTRNIVVDKARDTDIVNNSSISAALGYYITVDNLNLLPSASTMQQVTFYSGAVTSSGAQPSGSALGTARIRFVRKDGSTYRLYLFDARDASGARSTTFIPNARSVYSTEGLGLTADLVDYEIKDSTSNSLLFPLNVKNVKSLRDSQGNTDTSFSSVRYFNLTTDTNGRVTAAALNNEVFVSQDSSTFAIACFTDTGEFVDVTGTYSLGGNPTGTVITYDFGDANAGRPVRISSQVAKELVTQKTKTIRNQTISGSLTNGRLSLRKADAIDITSVTDNNGQDVTNLFTLYTNKTQSFYDVSYVTGPTSGITYPVTVVFRYFSHSAGDYFGPDSYVDVDYADVPYENSRRLSDTLDFRPRVADAGTAFTGTGSVVGSIPTPYTVVRADVEHYLDRIDKVYVTSSGKFGVVQGVAATEPTAPEDPADSMILYTLEVPAYTFDLEDIQATKINNRRYTMRDIGKLETRISNVEYYVSLNLLEQEAESKQIVDPDTGLNRFKNGFMTDNFIDHSVGNYVWEGYHVAMDSSTGTMRPDFSMNAFDLEADYSSSTNVVENEGLVTLPYSHVTFVAQNTRSTTMNVNPYAVFRWEGDVRMNPSVDSWIDTEYKDPQVTYRVFNNGRLTQTWQSWSLNWTGGEEVVKDQRTVTTPKHSELQPADSTEPGAWNKGRDLMRQSTRTFTDTTTTTTNIEVVNDKVLDTSVIPYMRSIEITLNGVGHRPEAKMHFFFDGKNVNDYIKPNNLSYGDNVVSDANGNFFATFRIPNNDSLRFRTGQKVLTVTDTADGVRENSTSWSEQIFTSSGIRQVRQQTIVATRETTETTVQDSVRWHDPLAQSFLVERNGGVFVTKIDVFFRLKDDIVPVNVEIRRMENGAPTQDVIPGAKKTLHPSDVSISEDGSTPTTFEFPYPIYLTDGAEYCFVVWTNSNKYEAWIARMGEKDLGTNRFIVEQPYAGVLFKSQNNSTWTADQTADMQFEIYCAKFDISAPAELVLNNKELDRITLPTNPVETVAGSNIVYVYRNLHNYIEGGRISITGATGGNGISAGDLNTTHDIADVSDPARIGIQVGSSATVSGFIGGAAMTINNTIQASLLNPNLPLMELSGTSLGLSYRGANGKSIDGTEDGYSIQSGYKSIANGQNNTLANPIVIASREDEIENMNGEKSFDMRITLASDNENISPVIDTQGMSIITPFVQINKAATDELDGSNNWANYVTQIAGLANPANSLRVYLDTYKPQGSDIVVSARFGNSQEEIVESEWMEITPIVEQVSGTADEFLENEYGLENVEDYTAYQVMIQLKSDSSTRYPICKRLRAIALGT